MLNVCVYCASSSQVRPVFFEAAGQLGEIMAREGMQLIYGGGHRGLMGKIADTVLENGGKAIGIIPRFMCEVEWNHTGLTELILVETMHERKEKLAEMADAVVALPGGCGTLDELFEIITWKRLGIFTKPIIICNTDHYFDPLVEMLERSIEENFMREEHRDMWTVVSDPAEIPGAIASAADWSENARNFAAL